MFSSHLSCKYKRLLTHHIFKKLLIKSVIRTKSLYFITSRIPLAYEKQKWKINVKRISHTPLGPLMFFPFYRFVYVLLSYGYVDIYYVRW